MMNCPDMILKKPRPFPSDDIDMYHSFVHIQCLPFSHVYKFIKKLQSHPKRQTDDDDDDDAVVAPIQKILDAVAAAAED
jgi:hypothetical protein